jgi:enamine deaminase RidA (YjgF/YER057c/UK114 family)
VVAQIHPDELGESVGYSPGMRAEGFVFVAGQIGGTPAGDGTFDVVDGFVGQFEQALENVCSVVEEAGGEPGNVVDMTVYVTDMDAYRDNRGPIGQAWKRVMGEHYPAMALVGVDELYNPDARVEIEVTAAIGESD